MQNFEAYRYVINFKEKLGKKKKSKIREVIWLGNTTFAQIFIE